MSGASSAGYKTLPKSWRETKLVTKVKEVERDERTLERKHLVESKTPAQLSAITSVADLPVPRALEQFWKPSEKKEKQEKAVVDDEDEEERR